MSPPLESLHAEIAFGSDPQRDQLAPRLQKLSDLGFSGIYPSDLFVVVDPTRSNPQGWPILFEEEQLTLLRRPDEHINTILRILPEFGLEIVSAHFLQTLPPPGASAEAITHFHDLLIEVAAQSGLRYATTHAGWSLAADDSRIMGEAALAFCKQQIPLEELYALIRKRAGEETFRAQSIDVYRSLCQRAARTGLSLTIESSCREWLPLSTSATAVKAFIEEVGEPNLGICLDAGHCHMQAIDPAAFALEAGDLLWETHFHDNFGDADAHFPVGIGNVNWKAVIQALKNIDYQGVITFEQREDALNAGNWRRLLQAAN